MSDYYIILTDIGNTKVAASIAGGDPISLNEMAVGSAVYTPSAGQTALVAEEWRGALNSLYRDLDNLNHVIAEAVVPTDVGGWEVNEVGVFDSAGDLFAIGKYPPTHKPALASGSGKELYIRFIMEISNNAAVTLNIDPTIVLVTIDQVDQKITEHDESADAHVKDFVMPFGGLNYPVIDTVDNKIGATAAAAVNGGTVSVPVDVMLGIGEEVTSGKTGRNRIFTTVGYTTNDLDIDTSYYLRGQVDSGGALEIYVQKGTDADGIPAGLKGTPNGATGGGFPTTVLDILLAKITTGAAGSVPAVTDFPNSRLTVLATNNHVAQSITDHDNSADPHSTVLAKITHVAQSITDHDSSADPHSTVLAKITHVAQSITDHDNSADPHSTVLAKITHVAQSITDHDALADAHAALMAKLITSNWTIRTSAADNYWYSVCWSPDLGLFVAVSANGTGNRVMTSPDGITWTIRTSAADNTWYSVCWSWNLFVAVSSTGTGNRVMTSPDGITWTIRTSAADCSWRSVCWSLERNLYVAVASSGPSQVMTSPDGITWTTRTSAADNTWHSVCWSPELGLFVAVGASSTGNRVMTSPNGFNWTIRTSAADNDWYSVCWSPELGLFVAVAETGTGNRVMTSPDGINWTIRTSAADNTWQSVCWSPGLGLFVAVAPGGTGTRLMTSPDGINWTIRTPAAGNSWRSVCWSPELGLFVVVGSTGTGTRVMTSLNCPTS